MWGKKPQNPEERKSDNKVAPHPHPACLLCDFVEDVAFSRKGAGSGTPNSYALQDDKRSMTSKSSNAYSEQNLGRGTPRPPPPIMSSNQDALWFQIVIRISQDRISQCTLATCASCDLDPDHSCLSSVISCVSPAGNPCWTFRVYALNWTSKRICKGKDRRVTPPLPGQSPLLLATMLVGSRAVPVWTPVRR